MSAADGISTPVCVKEEAEWDNESETEIYPEYEVKSELEWSPERIQPQDIVYKIPESSKKIKIEIDIVTQEHEELQLELNPIEKEFNCCSTEYETCKKTFYSAKSLAKHMLTHSNVCEFCNKTYSNKYSLTRHKKIHLCKHVPSRSCRNGQQKSESLDLIFKNQFACKFCPKRFHNNFVLTLHEATHKVKKTKVEN